MRQGETTFQGLREKPENTFEEGKTMKIKSCFRVAKEMDGN